MGCFGAVWFTAMHIGHSVSHWEQERNMKHEEGKTELEMGRSRLPPEKYVPLRTQSMGGLYF